MQPSRVHQHLCCSPHPPVPHTNHSLLHLADDCNEEKSPHTWERSPHCQGSSNAEMPTQRQERCPLPHEQLWWIGEASSSHQESPRDRAAPAHSTQEQGAAYPAIRPSLWKPFSQRYPAERSPISLLHLKYHLPSHFTWTGTTILSTAGL